MPGSEAFHFKEGALPSAIQLRQPRSHCILCCKLQVTIFTFFNCLQICIVIVAVVTSVLDSDSVWNLKFSRLSLDECLKC
ncbi:unnamed protein product [Prunus armeniaca]|uniref:Uncharacterized protein n=1 Tax=Prunus armeniaca TaxID=36596 RepID=A0A6J5UZB0_PRUAR|nr:unnamed protein product [Prunus armeniaca]